MANRFEVFVEIETLDAQTQREAQNRVQRWIETYGHTASGHGFEFVQMVRTKKRSVTMPPRSIITKRSQ